MCAEFILKPSVKGVAEQAGARVGASADAHPGHIRPFDRAPVLVWSEGGRCVELMQFSLVPEKSRSKRPDFASFNARLDTADTRPVWREAFARRHCLVPMNAFLEPIYSGQHAGTMVGFSQQNEDLLFATGIWEEWHSRETGEVITSFAILTDTAHPAVAGLGHDRSPVFLEPSLFDIWLSQPVRDPAALKHYLLQHRFSPELKSAVQRQMRPGWQKRVPKAGA